MRLAPLRIATRSSPLALWQANHVADLLRLLGEPRTIELVEIQTAGDQNREAPLQQAGGQGLFTKEIQHALLDGRADLAVHSLKDLPTLPVLGLCLAAVPKRGPASDVLISEKHKNLNQLPSGAKVATGSVRRRAQLLHRRPDLHIVGIRGNVETRVNKLVELGLDGLVLAQAGLERLGLTGRIAEVLDAQWMLPAVGQGALGLETRLADTATRNLVEKLNDAEAQAAVMAERALLCELGAGCQVPLGAQGVVEGQNLSLRAAVLDPEGRKRVQAHLCDSLDHAEELGKRLAAQLLSLGADELLRV